MKLNGGGSIRPNGEHHTNNHTHPAFHAFPLRCSRLPAIPVRATNLPSGRDRTDLWSWTFGSTCPRFHEDLAELAGLEATALADGLDEIYIRELMAALSLPPGDADGRPKSAEMLTLGSLFRLTTAPPTARLFALISTYLYAKEHGLLRE